MEGRGSFPKLIPILYQEKIDISVYHPGPVDAFYFYCK